VELLKGIAASIERGDSQAVESAVKEALSIGISAEEILNNGLVKGMTVISEQYKNNEIFIPEVLVAARAMKSGMTVIKPLLAKANVKSKGKIAVGTVKGDLHDIGKNIVGMLLEGAGFEILDLGADVDKEIFLDSVKKENADIIGMSSLLTTTMLYMKDVIKSLEEANLKQKVKIIVGGAPVTQSFADQIGADGYAPDAAKAVDLVKGLLNL
jgi:5-methyltetrahydrofolate--homocysteine methyltransferase